MSQIPIIKIPLENRAWKGTRLCIPNEFFMKHGLALELGWHVGKNAFMGTVYYYDQKSEFFPWSYSMKTYQNVFAPSIKQCLEDCQTMINIFYCGKQGYEFEQKPEIWIADPNKN